MKAGLVLATAILCIGGTGAVSNPLTASKSTLPDAGRLALGRQLVLVMTPSQANGSDLARGATAWVLMQKFNVFWRKALSGTTPSVTTGLLANLSEVRKSISVGVARIADQLPDVLGVIYARDLGAETLRAAITFYDSPPGRAAVARREALTAQMEALTPMDLAAEPSADPENQAEKIKNQYENMLSLRTEIQEITPAEKEFQNTPAGLALSAHAKRAQADIEAAQEAIWPQAAAKAEVSYCRVNKCGDDETIFFRHLAYVFEPAGFTDQPKFHTMGGFFADDLFTRPADVALAKVACAGDAQGVAAAVKGGADPNALGKMSTSDRGEQERVTPLLWAIDCNSMAGLDALITAGANPNAKGSFGQTAVTIAASLPDSVVLELLLKRGGDPNTEDDLQSALRNEQELGQSKAGWAALIAAGADINHPDHEGDTVADWAAMESDFGTVIELLNRGYRHNLSELARELSIDADCPIDPAKEGSWLKLTNVMKAKGFTIAPLYPCSGSSAH
jgi:uncharacterized protein